jgi:gluconokinase
MIDRFRRSWDQELLNILDIDLFNLPELSSWDEPVSGLNKQFSDRWKPLKEVPFLLSVGDGLTANLGSGCVDSSKLAVTIGSTGAMRTIVSGNPKVPMGLWAYCFGRDMNILGGSFTEGGNVLVWARQSLGIDTSEGIDNLLDGKKPDSHNLTVLPFLSGERSVGWNGSATATIKGLKMTTSGTDILQALCESIAYRFADVMERITPYLSTDLEVIASGGALVESRWWVQTIANVLNKPITVCDVEQQTLYGTAKLALKSLGLINNFDDIPIKRRYVSEPDVTLIEMMASARERQGDLYTKLM